VGADNDSLQVERLQKFLNEFEGAGLTVDGQYGPATVQAVNKYQRKYAREILRP
jgi:peptidoglycan hydrolase-like protein with peptidoglycan-binding domain